MSAKCKPTSVKHSPSKTTLSAFLLKLSRVKLFLAVICFCVAYIIRKFGYVTNHKDNSAAEEETGLLHSFWVTCLKWINRGDSKRTNTFNETIHSIAECIFTPIDITFDYLHYCGYWILQLFLRTVNFWTDFFSRIQIACYDWFSENSNFELAFFGFHTNTIILTAAVGFIIVGAVLLIYILCCRTKRSQYGVEDRRNKNELQTIPDAHLELRPSDWSVARLWRSLLLTTALCCALLSIPWEFVRIYQEEVANRVAISVKGMPADCIPSTMTAWQSVRSLLKWLLSWKHDECERYHQMLLVDPLWEVTPLMVLLSALTRCITRPAELLSSSFGRCLSLVFSEIPSPWQPVVMATLILLLLLLGIMVCGYRVSVPLCFRLEPSHPPQCQAKRGKTRQEMHCANECLSGRRPLGIANGSEFISMHPGKKGK